MQNLHRDNDDGDIENLILHGAKALYEADAEGRHKHDITYTSKMVDDLIEKVANEAEEEAKAIEERNKAKGNGIEEVAGDKKEFMSFGFAKVWEAGKATLAELSDDEEEAEMEEQDLGWGQVLLSAQAAEEKRRAEEAEQAALRIRKAKEVRRQHQTDGLLPEEDSPAKGKKGKGKAKAKGKGKGKALVDSEDDFALPDGNESESSIGDFSGEDEALFDAQGHPIIVENSKSKAKRMRILAMQQAAMAASAASGTQGTANDNAVAGPSVPPPSGKFNHLKESHGERMARKAQQKEARRQARLAQAQMAGTPPIASSSKTGATSVVNAMRISEAQTVIQWLYQSLHEVGAHDQKREWAKLGVLELAPWDRKRIYSDLARQVDEFFKMIGQLPYFGTQETRAKVFYLIDCKSPIIPDPTSDVVPPIPPSASVRVGTEPTTRQPTPSGSTRPVPTVNGVPVVVPSVRTGKLPPAPPNSIEQTPISGSTTQTLVFEPLPVRPAKRPVDAPHIDVPPVPPTTPSEPAAPTPPKPGSSVLNGVIECPFCRGSHTFIQCPIRPKVEDIEDLLQSFVADNATGPKMQGVSLMKNPARGELTTKAKRQAERTLAMYEAIGIRTSLSRPKAATMPPKPSTPVHNAESSSSIVHASSQVSKGTKIVSTPKGASGTRADAIVIDDDSDHEQSSARPSSVALRPSISAANVGSESERPSKRIRIDLSSGISNHTQPKLTLTPNGTPRESPRPANQANPPANNGHAAEVKSPAAKSNGHRGRPKIVHGCTICDSPRFHTAIDCPVVRAGPDSITQ